MPFLDRILLLGIMSSRFIQVAASMKKCRYELNARCS